MAAEKKSILKRQNTNDAILTASLKAGQLGLSDASGRLIQKSRRTDGEGENLIYIYPPLTEIEALIAAAGGSSTWGDPVSTSGDLPGSATLGEVRLVLDPGVLYWWDGSAWQSIAGEASASTAFAAVKLDPGAGITQSNPVQTIDLVRYSDPSADILENFSLVTYTDTPVSPFPATINAIEAQKTGTYFLAATIEGYFSNGSNPVNPKGFFIEVVKRTAAGVYNSLHSYYFDQRSTDPASPPLFQTSISLGAKLDAGDSLFIAFRGDATGGTWAFYPYGTATLSSPLQGSVEGSGLWETRDVGGESVFTPKTPPKYVYIGNDIDSTPNIKKAKVVIEAEVTGSVSGITVSGTDGALFDGFYAPTANPDEWQRGTDAAYIFKPTNNIYAINENTADNWQNCQYILVSTTPIGTYVPQQGNTNSPTAVSDTGGETSTGLFVKGDATTAGNHFIDDALIFAEKSGQAWSPDKNYMFWDQIEPGSGASYVWLSGGTPRFAIPVSGAGNATQMYRSVLLGGYTVGSEDANSDTSVGNLPVFDSAFIDCNTGTAGNPAKPDLGVGGAAQIVDGLLIGSSSLSGKRVVITPDDFQFVTSSEAPLVFDEYVNDEGQTRPQITGAPFGIATPFEALSGEIFGAAGGLHLYGSRYNKTSGVSELYLSSGQSFLETFSSIGEFEGYVKIGGGLAELRNAKPGGNTQLINEDGGGLLSLINGNATLSHASEVRLRSNVVGLYNNTDTKIFGLDPNTYIFNQRNRTPLSVGSVASADYAGQYAGTDSKVYFYAPDATGYVKHTAAGGIEADSQISRLNSTGATIIAFGQSSNAGVLSVKDELGVEKAFVEGVAGSAAFGQAKAMTWSSTYANFGHKDVIAGSGTGQYCFMQGSDGTAYINAPSGRSLRLNIAGAAEAIITSGLFAVQNDLAVNSSTNPYAATSVMYVNGCADIKGDGINRIVNFRDGTGTAVHYISDTGDNVIGATAGIRLLGDSFAVQVKDRTSDAATSGYGTFYSKNGKPFFSWNSTSTVYDLSAGGGTTRLTATASDTTEITLNETVVKTVTVTGAALGDTVVVNQQNGNTSPDNYFVANAYVSAANTVTFTIRGLDYTAAGSTRNFDIAVIQG